MRNGYNQKQQHKGGRTTTFSLPNVCSKPSMINDVHVPAKPFNIKADQCRHYSSSSGRCSDDPSLSPKVGCMGQVKKQQHHHQNYKLASILVFPTTSTTNYSNNNNTSTAAAVGFGHSRSSSNNFSYSKLLRLFSSKTLLTTPSSSVLATATTTCCRKPHHPNRLRSRSCEDGAIIGSPIINVADLDPPLPVIIKKDQVSDDGDNNNSLWKRRSGGAALKGLQIQLQVHIPISQPSQSLYDKK